MKESTGPKLKKSLTAQFICFVTFLYFIKESNHDCHWQHHIADDVRPIDVTKTFTPATMTSHSGPSPAKSWHTNKSGGWNCFKDDDDDKNEEREKDGSIDDIRC